MENQNIYPVPEQFEGLPSDPTAHPYYQDIQILINQGNWYAARAPMTELLALYPHDAYLHELATLFALAAPY